MASPMRENMIIAIDGPSGAGKSTLGRMLARALNLLYIDTGSMYRAVALAVMELSLRAPGHLGLGSLGRRGGNGLQGRHRLLPATPRRDDGVAPEFHAE